MAEPVDLAALTLEQRDVLHRALQIYGIQMDELGEMVATVTAIPFEENPMWLHTQNQKRIAQALNAAFVRAYP